MIFVPVVLILIVLKVNHVIKLISARPSTVRQQNLFNHIIKLISVCPSTVRQRNLENVNNKGRASLVQLRKTSPGKVKGNPKKIKRKVKKGNIPNP